MTRSVQDAALWRKPTTITEQLEAMRRKRIYLQKRLERSDLTATQRLRDESIVTDLTVSILMGEAKLAEWRDNPEDQRKPADTRGSTRRVPTGKATGKFQRWSGQ